MSTETQRYQEMMRDADERYHERQNIIYLYEQNSDKWGISEAANGEVLRNKANAAFLAFCTGAISEADWMKVEVENDRLSMEQDQGKMQTEVRSSRSDLLPDVREARLPLVRSSDETQIHNG